MGTPLVICRKRTAVAVLSSGVVISLTALTGGLAPAFADPKKDPIAPTTSVLPPKPNVTVAPKQPVAEVPWSAAPSSVPVAAPKPSVEAPPQTNEPVVTTPPAPVVTPSVTSTIPGPVSTVCHHDDASTGRTERHRQRFAGRPAQRFAELSVESVANGARRVGDEPETSGNQRRGDIAQRIRHS